MEPTDRALKGALEKVFELNASTVAPVPPAFAVEPGNITQIAISRVGGDFARFVCALEEHSCRIRIDPVPLDVGLGLAAAQSMRREIDTSNRSGDEYFLPTTSSSLLRRTTPVPRLEKWARTLRV